MDLDEIHFLEDCKICKHLKVCRIPGSARIPEDEDYCPRFEAEDKLTKYGEIK